MFYYLKTPNSSKYAYFETVQASLGLSEDLLERNCIQYLQEKHIVIQETNQKQ